MIKPICAEIAVKHQQNTERSEVTVVLSVFMFVWISQRGLGSLNPVRYTINNLEDTGTVVILGSKGSKVKATAIECVSVGCPQFECLLSLCASSSPSDDEWCGCLGRKPLLLLLYIQVTAVAR